MSAEHDYLKQQYLDGMAFFAQNIRVLEDAAYRKRHAGDDEGAEKNEEAVRRLQLAREGLQRMLSDQCKLVEGGITDSDKVLAELGMMRTGDRHHDKVIERAMGLIVAQRATLTNADRGRRALQKQLGKARARAEKSDELRKCVEALTKERERTLLGHAAHHCQDTLCSACPFEGYCRQEGIDVATQDMRMDGMYNRLRGVE